MFRIMVQDQLGREVRCDPRLLHHQTGGRTVPVFMMLTMVHATCPIAATSKTSLGKNNRQGIILGRAAYLILVLRRRHQDMAPAV